MNRAMSAVGDVGKPKSGGRRGTKTMCGGRGIMGEGGSDNTSVNATQAVRDADRGNSVSRYEEQLA